MKNFSPDILSETFSFPHFSGLFCVPRSAFFRGQPCLCQQKHVGMVSETYSEVLMLDSLEYAYHYFVNNAMMPYGIVDKDNNMHTPG